MSGGIHQMCVTKIAVETIVITAISAASSFPIVAPPRSVRRRLEDEVDRGGLAAGDRHVLGLGAELLMPRREGVLPRRKSREGELAIRSAHRVARRRQHSEVAMHPGVHVALHRNEFGLVVARWN